VVLFAHQAKEPPIAFARDPHQNLAVWIEDDRILSRAYFHGETQLSDDVFRLILAGVLKAASIGFVPLEADLLPTADFEADIREGRIVFDFGGCIFKKWSLTEWSVVPIPANPEALREHLDAGRVKSESLKRSLLPLASPRKASLWLDAQANQICKGMMLEDLVSLPSAPEVDAQGRPQSGERADQPQAVYFNAGRFHSEEDAKAWLELNALEMATVRSLEEGGFVAEFFDVSQCDASTVRSESVEDGVTMVFCREKQTSLVAPPLVEESERAAPTPVEKEVAEVSRDHLQLTEPVVNTSPSPAPEPCKPFGACVLECVCHEMGELRSYLLHSLMQMEPDSRSTRLAKRLVVRLERMHGECHSLGTTLYAEHFQAAALEGTQPGELELDDDLPEKALPTDRVEELRQLLHELAEHPGVELPYRIACRAMAGWLGNTKTPSPTPSPSVEEDEVDAVTLTELQRSLQQLEQVFLEVTGRELV
jgi:hypothetical protein